MLNYRKFLPDALMVLLFMAISFAYFAPACFEGRILYRHDSSAGRGAGQEATEYLQRTGERTRWTNGLFSGMPTYQLQPSYDSTNILSEAANAYHLWLPENVWYLFAYLLGFYILLRAFDFRYHLAALGSVLWAFSTYFLIIIAAGHIWKVWALAYLPPMIAGIVLCYRGRYLAGLLVTAIFAAMEVNANHIQMTYYYLFVILCMFVGWLVDSLRRRSYAHLLKATGAALAGGVLGVVINASNLYHTWEYSKETMRGKSELVKPESANQTDSGLERDYITQWSYGIGETWTLLVPNAKGGASVPLVENKTAMQKADANYMPVYQQIGQYWGEQPMTSGPVYVGAFVLFLFVLGLALVKGPLKWALLFATLLSVMLSWGKNFMPLTDFFIDYVPMYAKFRTVASILVIAEFTIPLLAMLCLKRIVEEPQLLRTNVRAVVVSFLLTGGAALLMAVAPGLFFDGFVSTQELAAFAQWPQDQAAPVLRNLADMRRAMLTADAWRSFVIVALGCAALGWYVYRCEKGKGSAIQLAAMLGVLCLADLWGVNKRYLNDSMFVSKQEREQAQPMTPTDKLILQDTTLDYRVLNLASNTFNENETSYYHKSIGGYHAAKLRRYQELIEAHIAPEMQAAIGAIVTAQGDMSQVRGDSVWPVLNMLNTRYMILPASQGQTLPVANPYAQGNAWFVDNIRYVEDANHELDGLAQVSLRHEAVADRRFEPILGQATPADSTASIKLVSYEPNRLEYTAESRQGGVVVFSEIYYPHGWTATVDGQPAELGRVNYVLRAMRLQPGQHKVVLSFLPASLSVTEGLAFGALALLAVIAILTIVLKIRKK